ncbi:hypothetical protein [Bradyrhizobium sp. 613_E4_N2_2]|uniref:hypothetical protein n=1 Tax=Bradyrhizobium sp. 613_E4_N2_2 TaxID=3240371 RepID=UPI003F890185
MEVARLDDGRIGIFIDGGHMLISEAQMVALRDKLAELTPPMSLTRLDFIIHGIT